MKRLIVILLSLTLLWGTTANASDTVQSFDTDTENNTANSDGSINTATVNVTADVSLDSGDYDKVIETKDNLPIFYWTDYKDFVKNTIAEQSDLQRIENTKDTLWAELDVTKNDYETVKESISNVESFESDFGNHVSFDMNLSKVFKHEDNTYDESSRVQLPSISSPATLQLDTPEDFKSDKGFELISIRPDDNGGKKAEEVKSAEYVDDIKKIQFEEKQFDSYVLFYNQNDNANAGGYYMNVVVGTGLPTFYWNDDTNFTKTVIATEQERQRVDNGDSFVATLTASGVDYSQLRSSSNFNFSKYEGEYESTLAFKLDLDTLLKNSSGTVDESSKRQLKTITSPASISFNLPSNLTRLTNKLKFIGIRSDGTVNEITHTVENSRLTFKESSFDTYVLYYNAYNGDYYKSVSIESGLPQFYWTDDKTFIKSNIASDSDNQRVENGDNFWGEYEVVNIDYKEIRKTLKGVGNYESKYNNCICFGTSMEKVIKNSNNEPDESTRAGLALIKDKASFGFDLPKKFKGSSTKLKLIALRTNGVVEEVSCSYNTNTNRLEFKDDRFNTYILYYNAKSKSTPSSEPTPEPSSEPTPEPSSEPSSSSYKTSEPTIIYVPTYPLPDPEVPEIPDTSITKLPQTDIDWLAMYEEPPLEVMNDVPALESSSNNVVYYIVIAGLVAVIAICGVVKRKKKK